MFKHIANPAIPTGRIVGVQFGHRSDSDIITGSSVQVISSDLFKNSIPVVGGAYDAHMGTTAPEYPCATCMHDKRSCTGHDGSLQLNYPILSPIALGDIRRWAKIACHGCGRILCPTERYIGLDRSIRLDTASKMSRTGILRCPYCKAIHPIIKKDPKEPLGIIVESSDKTQAPTLLLPHKIRDIFSRIRDCDVEALGKDIHPKTFIYTVVSIPSVVIRPDVKMIGGGRSTNDDLTTLVQVLIRANSSLPLVIPETMDNKLQKQIFDFQMIFYDMCKNTSQDAKYTTIPKRIKGKPGRIRLGLLGKRVFNMARDTIVGDPRLPINTVAIPMRHARTVQIAEIVQPFNREKLAMYVRNGTKTYPGATRVVKARNGATYSVESSNIELENGDIVYRDVIDGDPHNFNRQPSFTISNISGVVTVVYRDPEIIVNGMNVISCPFYNADFDGDAMNNIFAASYASRNEMLKMSRMSQWLISHTTSGPNTGQVDDTIIGSFEMTRDSVLLNKHHFMSIFNNTTRIPYWNTNSKFVTGRDLISFLLEPTPINLTATPEWVQNALSQYVKYIPAETLVVIERGKMIRGVLDKKTIGKNATGGIFHIIANDYSTEQSLETIFNMQQMAIAYIMMFGFTVGVQDMLLPPAAQTAIAEIISDLMNKSRLIDDQLVNGEIIPPISDTVGGFYEKAQINALTTFDEFIPTVFSNIDHRRNNLFKMIGCGSKGKFENMLSMVSANGPKLIDGERMQYRFGFMRTLPYFRRFETAPESRGYIPDSYINGVNMLGYIAGGMNARFDLICKALMTAITGDQNRKSVKCLESIITNNFRSAVRGRYIVQFAYGEDLTDPRSSERVKLPTVMLSDADFEAKFRMKGDPVFDAHFALMKRDRDEYRSRYMAYEQTNVNHPIDDSKLLPFDIQRIIIGVLRDYDNGGTNTSVSGDIAHTATLTQDVLTFCEDFPYATTNAGYKKARGGIPDYIRATFMLTNMMIRSYLHPNALQTLSRMQLTIILENIWNKYTKALVDPGTAIGTIAAQSFSEPLSQYMLDAHQRSAAGGTSRNTMNRVKEVLGAKPLAKSQAPIMLLSLKSPFCDSRESAQQVANIIEMMKLRLFVDNFGIFYEQFGTPVHSTTKHERELIAGFMKFNPLLAPPSDLIRWCIRFVLNKTTMILKNMSLETIIMKLRSDFPDIYFVYTPENDPVIVIRCYPRKSVFKNNITVKNLRELSTTLLDNNVRGIEGIVDASVTEIVRNEITADGSIKRRAETWAVQTNGCNIPDVLDYEFIDANVLNTDVIQEIRRIYGIEAAREKIIVEMRKLIEKCGTRHLTIYADEMTYTGYVTSIDNNGVKLREKHNHLLRIGFSSPIQTIEDVATNNRYNRIDGVTAPMIMGMVPQHGTQYNKFYINVAGIKQQNTPDDILNLL